MKRIWLIFLLSGLVSASATMACDICGSGAGGGYMGLLPGFRSKFLSLRYSYNGLSSHLGPGGSRTYLTSRERYRLLELWGAANIGKKYRLAVFMPFNFLRRENGNGVSTQSGPGDLSLIGYRQLLNRSGTSRKGKAVQQSLWAGAGLKLPVGSYNPEEKSIAEGVQNTFQLGTGSVDFSAHVLYDIRVMNVGLNWNSSYRYNTRNRYDYQYGNKLSSNLLAYYQVPTAGKSTFTPNTGLLLEWSAKDRNASQTRVWETGGRSLMGTLGLEWSNQRIGCGLNWQTPLSQDLGEGKLKAHSRGMVYLSYSF